MIKIQNNKYKAKEGELQDKIRTWRILSLVVIRVWKEKYNKIGITIKKLKDNGLINHPHNNAWFDYNRENKANFVLHCWVRMKMKIKNDQLFFQFLPMVCLFEQGV